MRWSIVLSGLDEVWAEIERDVGALALVVRVYLLH